MHTTNVHLHLINLDVPEVVSATCKGLLAASERDRADRFIRRSDADRWTVARAGLRDILAHYCEVTPRDIRFRYERLGKPVLDGPPAGSGIHFNLSHSGTFGAVAVTRLAPVGVDIEYRRSIPDRQEVASRFFSAHEYRQLLDIAEAQRDDAFLRCWTRKEAVIKTTGEGLSAELDSFDVSFEPGASPGVLRYCGQLADEDSWQLRQFESDEFVGAIAIRVSETAVVTDHGYWEFPTDRVARADRQK